MPVDLQESLTRWRSTREQLRSAQALQRDELHALQSQLATARDGVRRAYSITQIAKDAAQAERLIKDTAQAERVIKERMRKRGSAVPVLLRLFAHAPARLLRFGNQSVCPTCGHVCAGSSVRVLVDDSALQQTQGDAFAAFVAMCGDRSPEAPLGGGLDACSHPRRPKLATISASAGAPADVLILELEDFDEPERRFALRPEEIRAMPLHQASYRLVGVLLYSYNYHYIADALDADEGRWIRYDAYVNNAIGRPVEAPTGRDVHNRQVYYAIALVYVRVPGPQLE